MPEWIFSAKCRPIVLCKLWRGFAQC
jgi:hypothetical protein